jgi:hypothetical protein
MDLRRARLVRLVPCLSILAPLLPAQGGLRSEAARQYWYAGKAEVSRFTLEIERYGEMRRGDAIQVFVTEDFLADKQVKLEGADPPPGDRALPVLKLNFLQRFTTGIYDYSLMASVFAPAAGDDLRALKATASIQDWCGHVWEQVNRHGDVLRLVTHSYFEREADVSREQPARPLEDELWTRIRVAPETLPTGTFDAFPGLLHARLRHGPLVALPARGRLSEPEPAAGAVSYRTYEIAYEGERRSLAIRFEADFPHRIESWRETRGSDVVSRGVRTHLTVTDYWNHNKLDDGALRAELGLR